jgi:hypothetical protein
VRLGPERVVGKRWGDAGRQSNPGDGCSRGKDVGRAVGKSAAHVPEIRYGADSGEVDDPMLPRKASSECHGGPYPKPTQVVR